MVAFYPGLVKGTGDISHGIQCKSSVHQGPVLLTLFTEDKEQEVHMQRCKENFRSQNAMGGGTVVQPGILLSRGNIKDGNLAGILFP